MGKSASDIVVMGASWGGIDAYSRLLSPLPRDFAATILLVQHQRPDSGNRLAAILQKRTQLEVVSPEDRQEIRPGQVIVAAAGYHLLLDESGCVNYSLAAPVHFCRPAIDELFFSAGYAYGERVLGVLLTGANEDGAAGLDYIRRRGGMTLVQSPQTAEAPAMPEAAIALGAAMKVLSLEEITSHLMERVVGRLDD